MSMMQNDNEGRTREQSPAGRIALVAVATILLATALAGCLHSEGGPSIQQMNVLAGSEVPDGLANCDYDEDFMEGEIDEDDPDMADPAPWEDDEVDLPMPEEIGMQTLAPEGSDACDEAEYMVMIFLYTFANDRDTGRWVESFLEDWEEEYEDEGGDGWDDEWEDEWEDEWGDSWAEPCSQAFHGQNRIVMVWAFPMSLDFEEPDWEEWDEEDWENWDEEGWGAGFDTPYLDAQENVTAAIQDKYPGMEDFC